MDSTIVIQRTPLRQSSTYSYSSTSASTDDEGGSSGFSWSSASNDGSSFFSTSPATTAFSSSPSSSRSLSGTGKALGARRRASTSASNTLESFARLNTLPENDAESLLAGLDGFHLGPVPPNEPGLFRHGANQSGSLQPAAEITPWSPMHEGSHVAPSTPPTPAEIHEAVIAEQGSSSRTITSQAGPTEATPPEHDVSATDTARPAPQSKLSRKLFLKGRDRASSLSKLPFVRPKLERRTATNSSTTPCATPNATDTDETSSAQNSNNGKPRRRALERLQDRFARSAPSSPLLTPSESTERVHLFRSRPSSVVISGRGVEINYFTGHLHNLSASQPSSCSASEYQPALERMGAWGSTEDLTASGTNEVYEDALPRNLFDAVLPREVKLKVFSLVVESCIQEGDCITQERGWTAARAAQERWIGEPDGLRELVKMSRVCREWRDLVFDGQLWQNVHFSRTLGNDTFRSDGLVRLASYAGRFLRRLDLRGFSHLQDADLESIAESCMSQSGVTSLVHLDLSGCQTISTRTLHYLLAVSPSLQHLNVRGLSAVVSATCYVVLSSTVSSLKTLDVSLCRNLSAKALLESDQPDLENLYAAKIPSMDSHVVASIPYRFSKLQYLDIGYSRHISDEAFKRWPGKEEGGTALQGLRLSGCVRLTDQTCLNLAGKLPDLECLELASIGANMRDGGLVKLVESCPNLRKLDLEDAVNLSDRVLTALTPARNHRGPPSALEHLNITNVPESSEAALIRLVRACPDLRIVEASNCFNVSDVFVKAFAHHVRKYRLQGSELAVVDCRSVARQVLKDHANVTRPRRGYRDYVSRHFGYLEPDGRGRGLAECDDTRIVVHSFWTWQQVDDAEGAARSLRTAKLAREAGSGNSPYGYPFTLRAARRASFGMRGGGDGSERTGGSCIIS